MDNDTKTIVKLNVNGMSCEGCSGRVQSALVTVPGVRMAFVDLKSATATVELADESMDTASLMEAVTKLGFEARETSK